MRALVLVVAAGCGRIGFDAHTMTGGGSASGDGGMVADADPAVAFAGSCTSAATHAVGAGTVAHLTATLDGIVYADDFGELDSFQFDNGALVPRAMQPMFASEVDLLATSPAGDRILVLDLLGTPSYTIVDRSLVGPPLAAFASLEVGDFGAAADGTGFVVAGLQGSTNFNSSVALTGSTATTTIVANANSVPALAVVTGGYVVVTDEATPACHWRWIDATGTATGIAADDAFDCGFPAVAPDDAGHALMLWQGATNAQARVRDLSSRAWTSAAITIGPSGYFDAMFVATRGWYVATNSETAPAQILIVAADGSASAPMFTLPEVSGYVRLFAIAGRTYVAWIGSGSTLKVQPLCF